jgi:hypothetical protein
MGTKNATTKTSRLGKGKFMDGTITATKRSMKIGRHGKTILVHKVSIRSFMLLSREWPMFQLFLNAEHNNIDDFSATKLLYGK